MHGELTAILRCPRCRSPLLTAEERDSKRADRPVYCSKNACRYAKGFPVVRGQPVLIDFETSIFDERTFLENNGNSVQSRDDSRTKFTTRLRDLAKGPNRVAETYCGRFVDAIKSRAERPRVLIIGGGAIGSGTAQLYSDPDLDLVGTDVYVSSFTRLVADGHRLPFSDSSFDGVWIQAVLEHALDPTIVVSEIHRVLKFNGAVYADTPFMQQVHEGAYDFTRFTLSGHRWLFRKFHHDASGTVGGAGTALIWSIRFFVRALTGSNRLASATELAFFWLRFFDRVAKRRPNADAACGVFFFGRKLGTEISPKDMVAYYELQAVDHEPSRKVSDSS